MDNIEPPSDIARQRDVPKIPVLDDFGFVRLIDHLGDDLAIVRSARVSYDAAWRTGEDINSDHRLIRYLWKNHHSTPFESVVFQFEVMAPIFCTRQWVRHRMATWNEISARYRELPERFYLPKSENIGVQATKNKQGRDLTVERDRSAEIERLRVHCEAAFALYHDHLKEGWPKELARLCLPMSTYTHFFWKVDLRNLFHFLDLRMDDHAQFEIRQYAFAILECIKPIVPVAVAAWEKEKNE